MKERIYYHDTDHSGAVYHANYLKFLEEARSEYLEDRGYSVKGLMDRGVFFVVRRQEMEYKHPAFYDDVLEIKTGVKECTNVRIKFAYEIHNQSGRLIGRASTDLVCVGRDLELAELPEDVRNACALNKAGT